jgi:hypothetical protein
MAIFRSKKYLAAAEGQACVHCGVRDGTVVAAHYTGYRGHEFGKGKGIKVSDLLVADLCTTCHSAYDSHRISNLSGEYIRKIDQSEQFLTDIARTLARRIEQGVLKT